MFPLPDLYTVKSKIGSLENVKHKPGNIASFYKNVFIFDKNCYFNQFKKEEAVLLS